MPLRLLPKERVAAGWFCIGALLRVPACLSVVAVVAVDVGWLPFCELSARTVRPRVVVTVPGREPPLTVADERDEPPPCPSSLLDGRSVATPLADVRRRP